MQGAAEMGENEHLLNVYVKNNARGSCAEFFGYTVVDRSDRVADKRITRGKWLVCSSVCSMTSELGIVWDSRTCWHGHHFALKR